jgi:ribosome-associated heat shock protein Hsp15
MENPHDSGLETQRLDKWLWAARFFKTRNLAIEAVNGGKVHVDGQRVKPARAVRPGSRVSVRKGPYELIVVVRSLCAQRRPAPEAAQLYEETAESRSRRERLAAEMRQAAVQRDRHAGRPTKKERREISRVTGR